MARRRRRANGEGTVWKRPDGRWGAALCTGRDGSGRLVRCTVYARTQREALERLTRLRADLTAGTRDKIARTSRRAWRVLRLSGFARLDYRLDPDGQPYLIDVNPNPDVDFLEDFARAGEAAGIAPLAMLQRLVNLGLRYEPRWVQ